ncbi:MAG: septal ring lytic transglycosylase RlpA family protein [Sphingobacteriales bacterium]|nr:MAG: septal ring lytic transglycosylase RlpA family protein [Sphingobacteriales bacterium]
MIRPIFSVVVATALFSLSIGALAQPSTAVSEPRAVETAGSSGTIAWYGSKFNGRKTASGERFSASTLTMAHKTLPFGTRVRVTNLKNNKSVIVRVNDRGPGAPDLIGDVTFAAAQKLGMLRSGIAEAKLEVVGKAPRRMVKKS